MSSETELSLKLNKSGSRVAVLFAKNWALFFLFSMLIIFSITGKGFLSLNNFQNIVHLSTVALLLATAETFVIISGGIDLSVGYVMGLSSVLSAKIMQIMFENPAFTESSSIITGSIVAIAVSLLPGLVSGILITRYKVPPFIATLGMWGISQGITLKICEGFPVSYLPSRLVEIGNGYIFYYHSRAGASLFSKPAGVSNEQIKALIRVVPFSFIFLIVVVAVLWHLLKNCKFGQHTYAIGGSMDAAVRSGINVNRHLIKIYMLSSFLAGLAGVFNVFQTGVGNFTPAMAMYELFAVAAVVIGGASLMGGKGSVIGSVIGVLLISVLENGLLISGVEPFFRFIAVGIILIVAVVIDQLFPDLI